MKHYDERQYTIIKGVLENFGMSDEDIAATIMVGEKNNTPYFNLIKEVSEINDERFFVPLSEAEDNWDKMTDAITTWNNGVSDASYQFRMDDTDQMPNSSTAQYKISVDDSADNSSSSDSESDSESWSGAGREDLLADLFSFDDCNLKISDTPLDGNYNTNDIERLIKDFNSLLAFVSEDGTIRSLSKELEGLYEEIKDETKNRLVNVISDGAYLKNKIDDLAKLWEDYIMSLINKLKEANSQFGSSDGLREGLYGGSNGTINIGGINSSNSNSSNNVTTPSTVILSAIGTLTFTAITPLYETLGSQSTIQASLTDKYDVVGIYLNNDKYFYKIYDNKLNKYYYAEINGNSILSTDYMQFLKMNEESMMLTSTKIGDNVLTKYTDPNQVYAVKGTIEEGGINFAAIHDTNDDKDYYVALSSSNELVDTSKFITENSGVLAEKTTPESSEIEVVG